MIPRGLRDAHIIEAAKHIDHHGTPSARRSRRWHVIIDGKPYPLKYVISVAAQLAGIPLPSKRLFIAEEAKRFFTQRKYTLVDSSTAKSSGGALASNKLSPYAIYTRAELRRLFKTTDATINTGIFRLRGYHSVCLFVTEKKTSDRTPFKDHLDGDRLKWQGQLGGRKDHLIVDHVNLGLELLLFYRSSRYEHPGAGFRYEGVFRYQSSRGSKPASFVLVRDREASRRRGGDSSSGHSYWVVSPNVNNTEDNVEEWRQAMVRMRAAFMGYGPSDNEHAQIGPRFAGKLPRSVQAGDRVLIARRHDKAPVIVGFGVVHGPAVRRLRGFAPPGHLGSVRMLKPFRAWSRPPTGVPLGAAVRQIRSLVRLRPERSTAHREICDWMDRCLQNPGNSQLTSRHSHGKRDRARVASTLVAISSPQNKQLDYVVQTTARVFKAKVEESRLLQGYQMWLRQQHRELRSLTYGFLRCDGFEEERGNLVEAKCSTSREHIRMAVGQLLDYAFQGRASFKNVHKAILLPRKPSADIIEWLQSLQIEVIWREGAKFFDTAKGQFT